MSIYREIILDHAANPRNSGSIPHPAKTVILHNLLCGDRIQMDAIFKNEKLEQIKFCSKGCAISRAASSMLTEYAKKKTKTELRKFTKKDMMKMLGIKLGPNRLKCALLPLEALHSLLV